MPLTPDERATLLDIKREVGDIHADMADLKAKVIQHDVDIQSHHKQLFQHERRIGTLEYHAGIGANPMIDPKGRRARLQTPLSMPPKSAEELGLTATDSGTTWKTKDVGAVLRRFEEQEQQKLGAEHALELERKRFDRRLKNFGAIAALIVLLVSAAVATVTYLASHVTVVAPEPARR